MITGIITAVIFLLSISLILWNRFEKTRHNTKIIRLHKFFGIILIIMFGIHLVQTITLYRQRPVLMYLLGFMMLVAGLVCLISYIARKKYRRYWISIHKITAFIILICLAGHIFIGIDSLVQYQKKIQDISIEEVNIGYINDGTYTGEYDAGYIYAKVAVNVKNGKIEEVQLLEHRTERGKPAEIIIDTMKQRQQVKVDAITSATNSSKVIMKAAENALSGR